MKGFFVILAIMLSAACSNTTGPGCGKEKVTPVPYGYGAGWGGWDVKFCNRKGERIDCVVNNQVHRTYTSDEAVAICKEEY